MKGENNIYNNQLFSSVNSVFSVANRFFQVYGKVNMK